MKHLHFFYLILFLLCIFKNLNICLQMVYMVVEKHTSDLLHLKRSPGIRSWSMLVGMNGGGLTLCNLPTRNCIVFVSDTIFLFFFIQELCQLAWQQHITVQVNITIHKWYTKCFILVMYTPQVHTLFLQIMHGLYKIKEWPYIGIGTGACVFGALVLLGF